MITLPTNQNCCGCGACLVACPKEAIFLIEDECGFVYPLIDEGKCISCGKCLKTCSFSESGLDSKENQRVYAAAAKSDELLSCSTSGGIFATVAKEIVKLEGVAYGAAWREDFSVEHIGITDISELAKLQGSKYTQSSVYKSFPVIKKQLLNGKTVLFSGTPCQVSALYSYLGKQHDNLYTIDIICHGVASNQMLQDDIQYLESKHHGKAESVAFRTKDKGWGTSGRIVIGEKKFSYDITSSPYYYYYYLANTIFRDSCYNCRFAGEPRQGDLTIGDYWRIETAHPDISIDETKGISCVLVNSDKGQKLIDICREELILFDSTLEKIRERNGQLRGPCSMPEKRKEILELYAERDYKKIVACWKKDSRKKRMVEKLKRCIPNKLKRIIKRIVN